ncbi:membrane-bound lytic murein transglycosylase MltF [Oceanospirillum linum]|uniref:Membrane-bound lytic murein transglycosylase F n=1 Tax=Oceanospirillum linum TaxID=966 RepID=A0A1T1HGL4_OCELI|nr:membrane-bound lytic murein transglycosylase MltF [Oceanospirillum linum]OOV88978.1 lytic transglycosylase F [Oceanospirillum linum]SMP22554.1 membrane-bound lytic murein transglycosylase F [Oceanospirillum linum]
MAAATLLAAVSLSGCNQPTVLEEVKQNGTLKILTRNTPTTYYEGSDGPTGFEYELASLFADHLGVKLEIDSNHDIKGIYQSLEEGDAHLAAAGLEVNLDRIGDFYYSQGYMDVQPVVIYNRKQSRPKTVEDLVGKQTAVIAGTNNAFLLRNLQQKQPKLSWKETSDLEATDLIRMVHEQELDFAVINSNELGINKAYYSRVKEAFVLNETHKLAWAMPKRRDNTLYNAARDFFSQIESDGTLSQIRDRYYGHKEELNYVGVQLFLRHIRGRLPKYEKHFKKAAEKYNLDWRLLAATGYQESHWLPRAKSPTGVRGLMMLTLNTASDMGVTNRLDAKQSIYGGARYLSKLIRRMPEQILEPDRTWMALASYNVGYDHLEDARKITEHMKKDPNKWIDVREHLPLLQKRNWYRFTKHGFARGEEPVHYVQNIRQYYDILTWYDSRLQQVAQNQATEESVQKAVNFSIVPPVL